MALPNISSYTIDITQHALKGQKLFAQGNTRGIMAISNAPCKGKSFKIHRIKMETPLRYVKLLPLQGARFATHKKPRALPWAKSFCPFRACCLYEPIGRVEYTCETYLTIILYVLPPRFTMFRPFCRLWMR